MKSMDRSCVCRRGAGGRPAARVLRLVRAALLVACASVLGGGAASAFPIAIAGTEGLSVIVSGSGPVIATYLGNSASFSNDLFLSMTVSGPGLDLTPGNDVFVFNNQTSGIGATMNLGSFAIGTELIFRLHVNNTGNDFFSGAASRNPDGLAHARVQAEWQPGESLVSFEDLFGTPEGASGYNDLSFSFTNTSSTPTPGVPEPATVFLFGAGLGAAAVRRRRG